MAKKETRVKGKEDVRGYKRRFFHFLLERLSCVEKGEKEKRGDETN